MIPPSPPPRDALDRAYALLLRAYPAAFRERFGAEMLLCFRDRRRNLRAAPPAARLRFGLHLLADLAATLPAEHLSAARAIATRFLENAMTTGRLAGIALTLLAIAHIAYDAENPREQMGGWAILLTAVVFAAGAVLLTRPRRNP
ncbi:MAG TPA: hypothetical protein VHG28_03010 [Longimicrobiaceae bacterium]|nr:hypothetical protein [Longimicrobiaceae bacterium]